MGQQLSPPPDKRSTYWQRVCRLSSLLLGVWFLMTFIFTFFARELSAVTLFGWPFPFYMAAQGLPLLYLIIVAVYVARMRRLDRLLKNNNDTQ